MSILDSHGKSKAKQSKRQAMSKTSQATETQNKAGNKAGNKDEKKGEKKKGVACPRYQPRSLASKACKHLAKPNACQLSSAFLCVQYMIHNPAQFNDRQVADTLVSLRNLPIDEITKADLGKAKLLAEQQAKNQAHLETMQRFDKLDVAQDNAAQAQYSKNHRVLLKASEEHIAALEEIPFAMTLPLAGLNLAKHDVKIVNRYRPDGTRQLSIRHAMYLAAVVDAFPGAVVSEFEIKKQPKQNGKKSK